MNLMFWKKSPTAEVDEDESREMPDGRTGSPISPERKSRYDEISENSDDETKNEGPARSRWLVIAGVALGVLIVAASGFSIWKFFLVPSKPQQDISNTPPATQPIPLLDNRLIKLPQIGFRPAKKAQHESRPGKGKAKEEKSGEVQPQVEAPEIALPQVDHPVVVSHPTNIDELKKNSNTAQMQTVAPKKIQQTSVLPDKQTTGKQTAGNIQALPSNHNGDLLFDSKDPKSAAMSLKKMIDAMNASSNTPQGKPPK